MFAHQKLILQPYVGETLTVMPLSLLHAWHGMEVHTQSGAQDGCHSMTPVCPVLPPAQLGPLAMASTWLSTCQ